MKGYVGNILEVDLSNSSVNVEPLNWKWCEMFIGGKGLAARYLFELLKPKTDPLSPENILIFMTGPITGADPHPPGAAKGVVVTKSPATGSFLDSYFGGNFAAELKFAGFDGIIIRGKADVLSYLIIRDGFTEIRKCENLKGKGIYETTEYIENEVGDKNLKIAAIGPAGEYLVKFACIGFELHHQAGRGGSGCVMGSKNLKAIAVRGTKKVEVYDPDGLEKFVKETIKKEVFENPNMEAMRIAGTPSIVQLSNTTGILPVRNFQDGVFECADKIDWDAIKGSAFVKKTACYKCPIACRNITSARSGLFEGLTIEGPEYETLAMAGSNCGISDLYTIMKFNDLCDNYGLDTISTGNITAFIMECFEKKLLSKDEVSGLNPRFGDVESYLEIPKLISFRKGIGNLLAEGVKVVAEKIGKGSEHFALHVKGLEYPGYDPRGSFGMALAYATSDRGACHLRAWMPAYEAFGNLDPFTYQGKAEICVNDQNFNSVKWSMIFCDLYAIGYPTMVRFYSLITGNEVSEEKLKLIGERIWNLTRLFNVREGFQRKDDAVPPRILKDPLHSGPPKGYSIPRDQFEKMLDEYYGLRGWTREGVPTEEKLNILGLSDLFKHEV
jgi:aldehyde:ferredoxin oxidoreductase